MLSSIVLLLCFAACVAAASILFVLFGPVPVRRRITMVSRIQPPMPTAVGPVAMAGMPIFDPAQALFTPAHALPVISQPIAPPIAPPIAAAVEPPRRTQRPPASIAPLQLRRPRTMPSPLPRTRSARGTESRPDAFDVEHTAADAPMFELDDPTFLEDDRS